MKIGDRVRFLRKDGDGELVHVYGKVESQQGDVVKVRLTVGVIEVSLSELEVVR